MATAAEEARRRFFEGGAGTSGTGFGGRPARRVATIPQQAAAMPVDKNMAEFMAFGARKAAREARIKGGDQKHARAMANLASENAKQLATHKGSIDNKAAELAHNNALTLGAKTNEYNRSADNRKLISDAILAGAPVTPGMEGVYATGGVFTPNLQGAGIKLPGKAQDQKGYGVVQVGIGDDSNPTFGLLNKDTGEINTPMVQNIGGSGAQGPVPGQASVTQSSEQAAVMSLAQQYLQASREGRAKLLRDNPALAPQLKRYLTSDMGQ